jgi:hypothetical protein
LLCQYIELVSIPIEDVHIYPICYSGDMSTTTILPEGPIFDIAPLDRGKGLTNPDGIVLKISFDVSCLKAVNLRLGD